MKKYPNESLVDISIQYSKDKDLIEDYQRCKQSINLMYQHRVYITPTLNFYEKGTLEETNRVLR